MSLKAIPRTTDELLAMLREEFGSDFVLGSKPAPERLEEIYEDPLPRALRSLDEKDADHDAFARVVARELNGTYLVERDDKENLTIQWFDGARRIWVRAGGARRLWQEATDVLRRVARPGQKYGGSMGRSEMVISSDCVDYVVFYGVLGLITG